MRKRGRGREIGRPSWGREGREEEIGGREERKVVGREDREEKGEKKGKGEDQRE